MLGLVLALGGYTAAESTTQRDNALIAQTAVANAADARAVVEDERASAVATANLVVADATDVQTVAAPTVSEADLAVLTDAVDHLTALVADVPESVELAPSATATPAERASRGVTREALPTTDPEPGAETTAEATAEPEPEATAAPTPAAAPSPPAAPSPTTPSPAVPSTPGIGDAFRASLEATEADTTPDDAVAAGIVAAAARVANLSSQLRATAEQVVAAAAQAAATAAEMERVAAEAAAAVAKAAAQRASLAAYANGRIPADALCEVGFAPGQQLRCDAADALAALNESYRATFGSNLVVTDSYRSYSAQVACSRTKGRLCATPGTSNHGLGVALDLGDGVQTFGTVQHKWMAVHGGAFGWILPEWASITGSKREPWHWEFTG